MTPKIPCPHKTRVAMTDGSKKVIDVCCGPKGMWFDKHDPRVLFLDKRRETHIDTYPCGTKTNVIDPDIVGDFTDIKQPDDSFWLIVFDPPHIEQHTESQITKKYGSLQGEWRNEIRKGFSECFRVLKPNGVLIFKWNEVRFPVKEILALTEHKPLFGHKSGKKMQTHWLTFMKPLSTSKNAMKQDVKTFRIEVGAGAYKKGRDDYAGKVGYVYLCDECCNDWRIQFFSMGNNELLRNFDLNKCNIFFSRKQSLNDNQKEELLDKI